VKDSEVGHWNLFSVNGIGWWFRPFQPCVWQSDTRTGSLHGIQASCDQLYSRVPWCRNCVRPQGHLLEKWGEMALWESEEFRCDDAVGLKAWL